MTSARPVRVLAVVKGLGAGGAEQLLVSLARAVDPAAVRFEVAYVMAQKQALVPRLEAAGVATHLLGRGLADPRWLPRLVGLVRRGAFDVVHLHSPAVAAVARPVVRTSTRAAVVATEHNEWPSFARSTRVLNGITFGLNHAAVAVSEPVRRSMWSRWQPRVETLSHGVPYADLQARRSEGDARRRALGVGADEVLVTAIANVRPPKDHATMLRAARLALDQIPSLRFVNLGVPGPGQHPGEIEALHTALGLGERFRFLGLHPDPPAVLAATDLFTLSSRHEGLPISLLEAMAMGVPPVVTAVGGIPDVVTDGHDGRLVAPGDPAALAAAWTELARDAAARRRMGDAAAERARAFDIAHAARRWTEIYQGLAGRAG